VHLREIELREINALRTVAAGADPAGSWPAAEAA
jgi:hypothetical protein